MDGTINLYSYKLFIEPSKGVLKTLKLLLKFPPFDIKMRE
jgi:hypothetical protein